MNKDIFITTTLPYANSKPHVGHALEFVQADFLFKYLTTQNYNVNFNVGLDEHGKKIFEASLNENKTPKELVNELSFLWKDFCNSFNIEYTNFYRTSDDNHHENVKKIWTELLNNDELYIKDYESLYCVGCEEFKTENEIIENKCKLHNNKNLEIVKEKNWFYKIHKDTPNTKIFPNKLNELKNVIQGSDDISVSRIKEKVNWGVEVPNDNTQLIYVWFDALINYFLANRNWNKTFNIQLCGPDNLRFQGHFFQSILKSCKLKYTDVLLVHGTILDKDGNKMSKTIGNTVDPIEELNKYGLESLRYYFLAGISTFDNSNWDSDRLIKLYNSHLADDYGNLISRVIHLININNHDVINLKEGTFYLKASEEIKNLQKNLFNDFNIQNYLLGINKLCKAANQYLTEEAPWKKEDNIDILGDLYNFLYLITLLYKPVFKTKSENIIKSLNSLKKEIHFPKIKIK